MDARALIAELLRRDVPLVDDTTSLDTIPGFDSLAMVRLVVRVEGLLGRELVEEELERLGTLRDLEGLLK